MLELTKRMRMITDSLSSISSSFFIRFILRFYWILFYMVHEIEYCILECLKCVDGTSVVAVDIIPQVAYLLPTDVDGLV